jgi:hypothetical protein
MIDDLDSMSKEEVRVHYDDVCRHMPGGNDDNFKRDSNRSPPECSSEVLPLEPVYTLSVYMRR